MTKEKKMTEKELEIQETEENNQDELSTEELVETKIGTEGETGSCSLRKVLDSAQKSLKSDKRHDSKGRAKDVSLLEGYEDLSKPQKLSECEDLYVFNCPNCGHTHFRHAGYMELQVPWSNAKKEKKLSMDSTQVKICVKCKNSYLYYDGKTYDVSDMVDVEAWEKTEREAHRMTGAGGEC